MTTSSARPMNISTHSGLLISPDQSEFIAYLEDLPYYHSQGNRQIVTTPTNVDCATTQSCVQAAPFFWMSSHSTFQWMSTSQHKLPATHFLDADRPCIIFSGEADHNTEILSTIQSRKRNIMTATERCTRSPQVMDNK